MTKRSEPLNGLRLWREARGMSQEALARRLGVSQRTVSRIES
jgi:transcriptional regulator with XRE-family HTH domain